VTAVQHHEGTPKRGYSLPYHSILKETDPDAMSAIDAIVSHVYLRERSLDRATKELISVAVLAAIGASQEHIEGHVANAVRLGVEPVAVLEALELLVTMSGLTAFSRGVVAWNKACENPRATSPDSP
jgi:4-carboxymuconolactone decarboxylase